MTPTKLTQKIEHASAVDIRNDNCSKQDLLWYQNYRREVLKLPKERKPFKKKLTRKNKSVKVRTYEN